VLQLVASSCQVARANRAKVFPPPHLASASRTKKRRHGHAPKHGLPVWCVVPKKLGFSRFSPRHPLPPASCPLLLPSNPLLNSSTASPSGLSLSLAVLCLCPSVPPRHPMPLDWMCRVCVFVSGLGSLYLLLSAQSLLNSQASWFATLLSASAVYVCYSPTLLSPARLSASLCLWPLESATLPKSLIFPPPNSSTAPPLGWLLSLLLCFLL